MSADNILIILQKPNKTIAVYNVGFSSISAHEAWKDKLTRDDSVELTKSILNTQHYRPVKEFAKGETIAGAIRFCKKYMENNVVEYGYKNIIVYF